MAKTPDLRGGSNLRNMSMNPSMGQDFRDTGVLDGMASRSKAEKETNETTQYTTSGGIPGNTWGGENKGI